MKHEKLALFLVVFIWVMLFSIAGFMSTHDRRPPKTEPPKIDSLKIDSVNNKNIKQ